MAGYGDVLAVLRDYRNDIEAAVQSELEESLEGGTGQAQAFAARGGFAAFATPITNVHATGVGVRVRGGEVHPEDFVIKVYVFDKIDLGANTPSLTAQRYKDVEIDVEHLPIQEALMATGAPGIPNRQRHRPIPGGVSIAPINEAFVGTLGCFLRRVASGTEQIFALSNNHVMADVNRLPIGTPIVQPGPEIAPSQIGDVFAALSAFTPVQFPTAKLTPVVNRFDAAIAIVADRNLISTRTILGIANYTPTLQAPVPGMRVIKSGRTTGVTTGVITATRVNGVQINYGTRTNPRIATFNDTIEIIGDAGVPFSDRGDSGSVILNRDTGRPVALLFAGDGRTTTACDLGGVCQQFQAFPV
jgi:hypothetical protein